MMRRIGIVAVVLTLLFGGVILPATIPSVQAQDVCTLVYNFTINTQGWDFLATIATGDFGSYSGSAFRAGYYYIEDEGPDGLSGLYNTLYFGTEFTEQLSILEIRLTGAGTIGESPSAGTAGSAGWSAILDGVFDTFHEYGMDTPGNITYTDDIFATTLGFYIRVGNAVYDKDDESPHDPGGEFAATRVEVDYECLGSELVRPLSAADESPTFGMFNHEVAFEIAQEVTGIAEPYYPLHAGFSPYAVTAVARRPGMPVHAPASGTVERITPLEYLQCGEGVARPDETWFTNDGLGDCYTSFFQSEELGPLVGGTVPIANAYEVEISAGGLTFVYIVANAPAYISEGDTVSGGCVIGETLDVNDSSWTPYVGLNLWIISLSAPVTLSAEDILAGFTVMTAYETSLDTPDQALLSELIQYADGDHPCNQDPAVSECLGSNPRFLDNGNGWLIKGNTGAQFQIGGGVIINPGSEVYAAFLLDSETDYDVTVGGISIFNSLGTALQVRIGTAKEIFSLSPGDPVDGRVVLEDAAPAGPIADGVYEVGLKVTGSDPVFVEYACITDATNTPQVPTACYFANHSFDFASSGWTAGTTIQFPGDGTAIMPDGADGTLEQAFNLEAGDYTLSARVRAYYSTEVSIPSLPDGDIDLLYDMGDGETTLGALVFTTFDPGFQVLSTTFNLASPAAGTIEFYLDINDGSEELLGLTIDRFCLTRDGGYGGGGGIPPVINPTCETVANPNDSSVGAWIAWLWAKLDQFFQCDLMALLNDLYVQVVNGINTMLRFARYVIIVAQRQASWIGSDGIPWLNGHLNNIALGRTTTILEGGGECHDIFCLLQSLIERVLGPLVDAITQLLDVLLDVFTAVVGLLLNVVTGVIGLLFSLFGSIIQFIVRMVNYLGAIITGFNSATPTPLPGIPQCQLDPQGNAVCIGLWMLENTVFADEGVLYIPLLIGAISIFLLFWLVDTFRREISNLGDKL